MTAPSTNPTLDGERSIPTIFPGEFQARTAQTVKSEAHKGSHYL